MSGLPILGDRKLVLPLALCIRRPRSGFDEFAVFAIHIHVQDRGLALSQRRKRQLAREQPGPARVVTVSGGGHFLPLDRPDAVVENPKAFVVPRTADL